MYICFLQKVSPSGDKRHLKSGKAFVFHSQGSNSPKFSFGLNGLIVVWNKKKKQEKNSAQAQLLNRSGVQALTKGN